MCGTVRVQRADGDTPQQAGKDVRHKLDDCARGSVSEVVAMPFSNSPSQSCSVGSLWSMQAFWHVTELIELRHVHSSLRTKPTLEKDLVELAVRHFLPRLTDQQVNDILELRNFRKMPDLVAWVRSVQALRYLLWSPRFIR